MTDLLTLALLLGSAAAGYCVGRDTLARANRRLRRELAYARDERDAAVGRLDLMLNPREGLRISVKGEPLSTQERR